MVNRSSVYAHSIRVCMHFPFNTENSVNSNSKSFIPPQKTRSFKNVSRINLNVGIQELQQEPLIPTSTRYDKL